MEGCLPQGSAGHCGKPRVHRPRQQHRFPSERDQLDGGGRGEDDTKGLQFQTRSNWRGKLAIFVFKERFGYEEFTRTNEMLEVPAESAGHSKVTGSMEEAYICLQDVGDDEKEDSPGLRAAALFSYLTGRLSAARPEKRFPTGSFAEPGWPWRLAPT